MHHVTGHRHHYVHLTTFADDSVTLCGLSTTSDDLDPVHWEYGDETVSGHMADCEECYQKMHSTRTDPVQVRTDNQPTSKETP